MSLLWDVSYIWYNVYPSNRNQEEAAARKEAKKEAAEEMKDMLDMEED